MAKWILTSKDSCRDLVEGDSNSASAAAASRSARRTRRRDRQARRAPAGALEPAPGLERRNSRRIAPRQVHRARLRAVRLGVLLAERAATRRVRRDDLDEAVCEGLDGGRERRETPA